MAEAASRGALEGIRVIELASYVSGPYAGMLLADFGAEVIKIEPPIHGDPFRGWGQVDYSATFGSVNRNKKSVVLDLKTEAGQAAARELIATADIVVENFRPGTLERLNLGYDKCRTGNPRLIWCSITGFGNFGPRADQPGYDTVGQAMGGLLSLLTDMEAPKPMGISFADHLAGMVACNGVLAALQARHVTGKGQRVDTSLLESVVSFIGENAARYFENGKIPNRATRTHTAQVYAFVAGDGKPFVIHLSSPEKFWRGLLKVAGRLEWKDDPRFNPRPSRQKNYNILHQGLSEVFATKDREHWLRLLSEEDVPSSALNDFAEVFNDPQVQTLEMRVKVPHPKLGEVELIRNGARLSETPVKVHKCSPELGEHNDELLGGEARAQGRKA
jgi:crotonobetainyl-CoA:carnitine CoA-transferase CaiB-like acyl-CoA transferase